MDKTTETVKGGGLLMKALVIAPQPFFTPRGTPFSVYYRTLVTSELGVEVDLLTYGEGQDVEIPGVRIIRTPRFSWLGNIKTGPSFLKLFLDMFIVLRAVGLLLGRRYDFVHAHEEAVFFCTLLKPVFGFKLVYDMHSSLPQQLENFNFTSSRFFIGLFQKLEDTSIRASDAVITICPALANYIEGLIGKQHTHFLIENSIFDEVRVVEKKSAPAHTLDKEVAQQALIDLPKNTDLVVYAGTLEPYQGIDILIKAFKTVQATCPTARLLIAGGSQEQVRQYANLARQEGVAEFCVFTGRVQQAVAKHYTGIATVLVSPRIAGINTPLKVYEQLAGGTPLVATNIYSHTQILNKSVAFLVEPNVEGLASGIVEALTSKEEGKRRAAEAQRLYDSEYSRPVYVSKMQRLLEILK
ncbi:MAG: glycosyltransferase family 4 protein [Gammaproteobacteria bacterium]